MATDRKWMKMFHMVNVGYSGRAFSKRPGWWGPPLHHPVENFIRQWEVVPRHVASGDSTDYSLDAKNRVNLPPKFRAQLSDGLVVSIGFRQPCIEVYPPTSSTRSRNARSPSSIRWSDEYRAITRRFNNYASTPSSTLPSHHAQADAARARGHRRFDPGTGCKDYIEIWDPGAWQRAQEDTSILEAGGALATLLDMTRAHVPVLAGE